MNLLPLYNKKKNSNKIYNFIHNSNIIHNNYYDYSKFIYTNTHTKGIVICPIHGDFLVTPNRHLSGKTGCPSCGLIKSQKDNLKRIETSKKSFIEKSRSIFGGEYDYSKFNYINFNIKGIIICPIHGEFLKTPNKHIISKQGCPKCKIKISKGEKEILDILNKRGFTFETQFIIKNNEYLKNKPFDFYLKDLNLLIEFDGEQHYKIKFNMNEEELLNRMKIDQSKEKIAIELSYNFIRIKYNDNIHKKLSEYFERSTTIEITFNNLNGRE